MHAATDWPTDRVSLGEIIIRTASDHIIRQMAPLIVTGECDKRRIVKTSFQCLRC